MKKQLLYWLYIRTGNLVKCLKLWEKTGEKYKVNNKELRNVLKHYYMYNYKNYHNADLNWIDTSEVTNMDFLFGAGGMIYFNGDISKWNTKKVKSMQAMFAYNPIFNGNIGSWDVSNVENMECMFKNTKSFNSDISNWNVSNVKNMLHMFYNAKSFNQNISSWDINKCKDTQGMFDGTTFFKNNRNKILKI